MKTVILIETAEKPIEIIDFGCVASDKDVALFLSRYAELWDGKINHQDGYRYALVHGERLIIIEDTEKPPVTVLLSWCTKHRSYAYVITELGNVLEDSGCAQFQTTNVFDLERKIQRNERTRTFWLSPEEIKTLLEAACDCKDLTIQKEWHEK